MSKILKGWADFGEPIGRITDEDVWKFVMRHSTVFDRLNSKKMVEMTQWAFTILQDRTEWGTYWRNKKNWRFYDKNGLIEAES